MIKKQQKWIALLVTCTFIWLLQVSVMPLSAANAPEQISSANNEQGPRYVEEEGVSGYQAKKKSILPIILIGAGVVAVAAVLFLVVLKTKYDITGEWTLLRTRAGASVTTRYLTFTGDKKSGTVRIDFNTWNSSLPDTGSYTVKTKAVQFNQYWDEYPEDYEYHYEGNFTDKDAMSGTYHMNEPAGDSETGTWSATRHVAAATSLQLASETPQRDSNHKNHH